ncbi:rod shape-determining protein MreC [Sphingomonas changbaiensis NBRC 104936]|uniref:Cell shape-determining protein MreC n=1 Tax=Sphingomonas changbaiensis NBRC 104936 TaxID=1219043 RepID=A0A0E9MNK9_9SPHN|nr:rod shape-determining protein MreC [Sphingomonas changbaiensis]GAO39001.1 rod shape-determining protein MreC [Sphingomonas changbaiensis NBRC 104936]
MARPSNRRPGYSRRAQYGLFFGYVAAVSGAAIALLLLILSAVDPNGFGALKGAISDATLPITAGGRWVVQRSSDAGGSIGSYINAAGHVRQLQAEAKENQTKLIEARALAFENARLKRLLGITERGTRPVAVARLVGSTGSSIRRYAILNAGYLNGVRSGMPVRGPGGLVGRIASAGAISARVSLITDGGMIVPVRRVPDGTPAIATGTGDGLIDIRALGAENTTFRRGDVFVTSGAGGVYPPNVPVAIINRVTRESFFARPVSDPAALDFAIVEPVYQPQVEVQRRILPPLPGQ